MVTPLHAYLALVAALAAQRAVELALSERNARGLRALGGIEAGRGHYPAMVTLHAAFLVACAAAAIAARRPPPAILAAAALVMLGVAQAIRWWAIASLGARWTTRVIAIPGAAPVVAGPYRFIRHPNYLAVALEIAAVPLVYGAWRTALLFSATNAVILALRIRAEEHALGVAWASAFRDTPRLFPGRRGHVA